MASRHWIVLGAAVTAAGLVLSGTAPVVEHGAMRVEGPQNTGGGALVLVGWALLAWGIHRFGRTG